MGNQGSRSDVQEDLQKRIDEIASKLITQMKFKDMKNLDKPEYCDNLVILTSKVIDNINS